MIKVWGWTHTTSAQKDSAAPSTQSTCQVKPDYTLDREKILSPWLKRPTKDLSNSLHLFWLSLASHSCCSTISTSSHSSDKWHVPALPAEKQTNKWGWMLLCQSRENEYLNMRTIQSYLFKCKLLFLFVMFMNTVFYPPLPGFHISQVK